MLRSEPADDDRCQRNGSPGRMPINLRYDLRFRSDQALLDRLAAAWHQIDRMGEGAIKPRWWEALHAGRMRRSLIRHRAMYRIKARVHVAFTHLTGALEAGEPIVIFLPFLLVAWWIAPAWLPSRADLRGPDDAFLLRCEIEDLHAELRRRRHSPAVTVRQQHAR